MDSMKAAGLSDDSLAVLLLCSHLTNVPGDSLSPYSIAEWNILSAKICESNWRSPGALLGITASNLEEGLGITSDEAKRISLLLERAAAAGFAIENLRSQGIRLITTTEASYPVRLKDKLKSHAPPVIFYSGDLELTSGKSVAIVGSRAVDQPGENFTAALARRCAENGVCVVSGGAKGVDVISMKTALDHGGTSIGVLSDALIKKIRDPFAREAILQKRLLLLSQFHPAVGFQVANAMARNKVVYALADYAFVVSSDLESGGTWAGATENLRKGYAPLFVRNCAEAPKGNNALIEKGGIPFGDSDVQDFNFDLLPELSQKISTDPEKLTVSEQLSLFGRDKR